MLLVRVQSVGPLEKYRSVKVIGETIGWDNGADIDPNVLYYDPKPAWMEEAAKASQ